MSKQVEAAMGTEGTIMEEQNRLWVNISAPGNLHFVLGDGKEMDVKQRRKRR